MSNVEKTLAERGDRYGDFSVHAGICQSLKELMMDQQGWVRLDTTQRQALDVIADKIARILSGDPNYADNWHDIQGYAKLVEDRLPKVKSDVGIGESSVQYEGAARPEAAPVDPLQDFLEKKLGVGDVQMGRPRNASEVGIPEEVMQTIRELRALGINLTEITVYDKDTKRTNTYKL